MRRASTPSMQAQRKFETRSARLARMRGEADDHGPKSYLVRYRLDTVGKTMSARSGKGGEIAVHLFLAGPDYITPGPTWILDTPWGHWALSTLLHADDYHRGLGQAPSISRGLCLDGDSGTYLENMPEIIAEALSLI